jgi:uncharacterized protein
MERASGPSDDKIIEATIKFVTTYFEDPKFDASHDIQHVLRVRDNAMYILLEEQASRADSLIGHSDPLVVHLAALLHDVDDKKYKSSATEAAAEPQVMAFMNTVAPELASKVYHIVEGVSYSSEIKDPKKVLALIEQYPELAIVQDADRLDAIGAIGIGRCFTFGGARGSSGMGTAIEHFEEKLLKLEGMMKTGTGKAMAADRTRRIREFMAWWTDEAGPAPSNGEQRKPEGSVQR